MRAGCHSFHVQIIGIDIGGTKCAVSILRGGAVVEIDRFPTQDYAASFARFRKTVEGWFDEVIAELAEDSGSP